MRAIRKIRLGLAVLALVLPALASDLAVLQNGFSIRHERRATIGFMTRLYTAADSTSYVDIPTNQIDHFEKDLSLTVSSATPTETQNLDQVINDVSGRHHLDPDLVNSVIHAESGYNPRAVSRKGAQGLMQLMPQTASQLGVTNPFDPSANVEGGTRYLRTLLERYNFDLVKALAAYNAGPQRVEQYQGVPPYAETRAYVARIVKDFNRKKVAQQKAAASAKTPPKKPQTGASAAAKQSAASASTQPQAR